MYAEMIKYTLKCADGHAFDSWFASADAYDSLLASGHIACAQCGTSQVGKAIMAPRVRTDRPSRPAQPSPNTGEGAQAEMARMRAQVEQNATYVGRDFARSARDMYLGDVPQRAIWGEASLHEAKSLIEDGVPVAPLPFVPKRKVN